MDYSLKLAKKVGRDAKLKMSSKTHITFNYIQVVNAAVKVLISHVLLSKLKKIQRDVLDKS